MNYKVKEIKDGVQLHLINTDKFKTNLIAVFLTTPLNRETITYDSVLSAVLRRGSQNMPTQEQISKELEEMYGATFDCGINKTGDNHIFKFYLEAINDNFCPQDDEKMLTTSIEKLLEIVCNPLLEDGHFKDEYVNQEKENIKHIIEGKKDNKALYAQDRCIEEMYKGENFGLYKYGYVEDLEKINSKNLYEHYLKLKDECKIDIFVSGIIQENDETEIEKNENIQNLKPRKANYIVNKVEQKKDVEEKEITESMEVTQGKLVIGLDVNIENEDMKYDVLVYNSILGGTANSKLFQNVREKASLAYTASSSYIRYKNNIFINCGIEIDNYEKAVNIIKQQLEDMKNGNFTEEDLQNSKKVILSNIKSIDDEQDTEITYFLGQELTNNHISLEEYMKMIENVTKENVIKIANGVKINTIYFLRS